MSARRPPHGTEPPAARGSVREVSGTIEQQAETEAAPGEATAMATALQAHRKAIEADAEHSVIVQIDEDWLARLELPLD